MNFDEYSARAVETDNINPAMHGDQLCGPDPQSRLKAVKVALLGILSKTGAVASAAKRLYCMDGEQVLPRDLLENLLRGELGDLLWYSDLLARNTNTNLGTAAQGVLARLNWGDSYQSDISAFLKTREARITEFSRMAAHLDEIPVSEAQTDLPSISEEFRAVRISMLGISDYSGRISQRAKRLFSWDHPCTTDEEFDQLIVAIFGELHHELGGLVRHMDMLARSLGYGLSEVADWNLKRARDQWAHLDSFELPPYDGGFPSAYRFPRQMNFEFLEFDPEGDSQHEMFRSTHVGSRVKFARMWLLEKGEHTGDPLDDNSSEDDGYRFHDVFHLAHAAVLGWSPVLRKLLEIKRRNGSHPDHPAYGNKYYDRVEDGGRGIVTEEGLVAFVFRTVEVEPHIYDLGRLDSDLFRHVTRMVKGLEVESQPVAAWRSAYLQAFDVFEEIVANKGGIVECDLDQRSLRYCDNRAGS